MDFGFSEEQDLLRSSVRRFLDERCPLEEVRRLSETSPGYCEAQWAELAALGWLGLTIPEAYGGAGLGWVDLIVVLEETGRSLFPSPLLGHVLCSTAITELGNPVQQERWLPGLAAGSCIGSVALIEESDLSAPEGTQLRGVPVDGGYELSGQKRLVPDPETAGLFIVSFCTGDAPDDIALAVVDAQSTLVSAKSFPMIDATKRMGNIELNAVVVKNEDILATGAEAVTRLLDAGALAVTAECSGAVDAAIKMTARYACDRLQFGRPIGQYQGVKHPLAEMYVDLESFRSLLYYAAWCRDTGQEDRSRYASLAKAYATDAFIRTGLDSIQLHGAAGFTTACDIQLYFKRSKWARPMFGDADFHYERVLELRGV